MSSIYKSNGIYPIAKVNINDLYTTDTYTVPAELAHNPAKILMAIYGSTYNGDLLWAINRIRNPYKELTANRVLTLPSIQAASSAVMPGISKANSSIKIKGVKTTGNGNTKLTY